MWILSFVPDAWLHYAVLGILSAGAVAYVVSLIPLLPYREVIRLAGTALLVAGVYFYGSYETEMDWRNRASEMQKEVDEAKVKSAAANDQIKDLIAEKKKDIHDKQIIIQKQIVQDAEKIDKQCVVDPEVITILNNSASGK